MVKKASAASGNKPKAGWGKAKPEGEATAIPENETAEETAARLARDFPPKEPEMGVGLDGSPAVASQPADEVTPPKAKRGGRKADAGHSPKQDVTHDESVNLSNMRTDLVEGVEAIERLAEEIGAIKDDVKELFGRLKSKGYSVKMIRKVLARRAMDADQRTEEDDLLALYEEVLKDMD